MARGGGGVGCRPVAVMVRASPWRVTGAPRQRRGWPVGERPVHREVLLHPAVPDLAAAWPGQRGRDVRGEEGGDQVVRGADAGGGLEKLWCDVGTVAGENQDRVRLADRAGDAVPGVL